MFGKSVVLVVALGACGCTLLSMRQARLQAASELVEIQLKIRDQDEHLWKLRTRIGAAVAPEHVREMAAAIGPLRPLWPAAPGSTVIPDTRQAVDSPSPFRPIPPPPKAESKPETPAKPAGKPKPAPKPDKGQPARARLALEPER